MNNQKSYWTRRVSRRYILRGGAAAGAGLAAIGLIGCGGDDDAPPGPGTGTTSPGATATTATSQADPFTTELVDTSGQAQRGGVINFWATGDETTLDALASSRGAGFGGPAEPAYSRLLREEYVLGGSGHPGFTGDLAESYEVPDPLTLVFKLREAQFDPRPPVNGRVVTAEDIVFSAEKMRSLSPYASQLFHSVDPASPIESVRAIDSQTVEMKLAHPWSPILAMLAHGNLLIQPVEADGGFDARQDPRGTGVWMLDQYEQSVALRWRRNPNWYGSQEFPYVDGWDQHIIPEHAVRIAQFRARAIDVLRPSGPSIINAGDLIGIKRAAPEVNTILGEMDSNITSIAFGSRPGSPFADVRLRQGISMALDRESLGGAFSGAREYAAEGIDYEYELDSHMTAAWAAGDYWLNPRDASLWGDAGKFWTHDVAEARKLISAANADGMEFPYNVSSRTHGVEHSEIIAEWLTQVGLRPNIRTADYNTEFLPQIWVPGPVKGDFDGMTTGNSGSWQPHPSVSLYTTHHSAGSYTTGRDWPDGGQATIDGMIEDSFSIFDENELRSKIHDIQRELAAYMSGSTYTYSNRRFEAWWPWVENLWVFQRPRGDLTWQHVWLNESKR